MKNFWLIWYYVWLSIFFQIKVLYLTFIGYNMILSYLLLLVVYWIIGALSYFINEKLTDKKTGDMVFMGFILPVLLAPVLFFLLGYFVFDKEIIYQFIYEEGEERGFENYVRMVIYLVFCFLIVIGIILYLRYFNDILSPYATSYAHKNFLYGTFGEALFLILLVIFYPLYSNVLSKLIK